MGNSGLMQGSLRAENGEDEVLYPLSVSILTVQVADGPGLLFPSLLANTYFVSMTGIHLMEGWLM